MSPKNEDGKERILESAKRIFARKGFDGARVDEIARGARVPKSLIYYHFKGKKQLLEQLFEDSFDDYEKTIRLAMTDSENAEKHYFKFMDRNRDVIRVIFLESLKQGSSPPPIFKVTERLMEVEQDLDEKAGGARRKDDHRRLVVEFFTNLIPNVAFMCFQDSWCDYFKVNKKELTEDFIHAFQVTHMAGHEKKEK